jgi:uncharacterized protein (DUF2267 family)
MAGRPLTYDSKKAFLLEVTNEDRYVENDFCGTGEREVRAVFRVLSMYLSPCFLDALKKELPEDIACLIEAQEAI